MGDLIGDRPVLEAGGDNEQLAGSQHYWLGILQLDAKFPVPTEEKFVFLVVMPGELTFEPRDTHNGVVHRREVGRFPWPLE